jgi:UDP-galactopyranose mutase
MDLELLSTIAEARPDWYVIILGPVAKIDLASLPANSNIHYLGMKPYEELPAYLAGWDVALLPFECNESTRFISPTKTLEYLAGGKPVVSTPIRDVIQPYGEQGLVSIAETASDFLVAIEELLSEQSRPDRHAIDSFLTQTSWNATWRKMSQLLHQAVALQLFHSRAAFSRPLLDVSAGSSLRKGRNHV